jgi:two-component system cell cycle sensor histidine kinase/response regulator CckA
MEMKAVTEKLNFLIIEDNPGDVRLVQEMLLEISGGDYNSEAVFRLQPGCERLQKGEIDLVLLDLLLPDSEGLDTVRAIQRCGPTVPIVVLTVVKDEKSAIEAVSIGAQDYLVKGEMTSSMLAKSIRYAIARKGLETALRESEERFRLAADNYPAAFAIYDKDLRFEFVNETFVRMLGRPREEIIGKKDEELIPHEVTTRYLPILRDAAKTGETQSTEFSFSISGSKFTYITTFVPVLDEGGKVRQVAAFNSDISQRKKAEEALRQSEARYRQLSESLEETVKAKVEELRRIQSLAQIGQMVSVVAHEIRNPLQNIRMGIETIRMMLQPDSEKREVLDEIDHGINLLNNTVTELLEYSKPVELKRSPWPISEVCNQATRGLSHLLENISVEISCNPEKEKVWIDGAKMIRVLMNLLNNSTDAMPEGGKVSVSSRLFQDDGQKKLRLIVSDTGRGIPPEKLPLVQEPFYTTKLHGTGLGLSICRRIVEAHGGTLTISSQFNKGTTIEIVIPVQEVKEEG